MMDPGVVEVPDLHAPDEWLSPVQLRNLASEIALRRRWRG